MLPGTGNSVSSLQIAGNVMSDFGMNLIHSAKCLSFQNGIERILILRAVGKYEQSPRCGQQMGLWKAHHPGKSWVREDFEGKGSENNIKNKKRHNLSCTCITDLGLNFESPCSTPSIP